VWECTRSKHGSRKSNPGPSHRVCVSVCVHTLLYACRSGEVRRVGCHRGFWRDRQEALLGGSAESFGLSLRGKGGGGGEEWGWGMLGWGRGDREGAEGRVLR
jgi:hypothetical protein